MLEKQAKGLDRERNASQDGAARVLIQVMIATFWDRR
jgi:hypothetical protein